MFDMTRRALITVTMDCDHRYEDEFNRWYNEEHMPERARLPGFVVGRRFVSVEGSPRYLATYEYENLDAFKTPEYLALPLESGTRWNVQTSPRSANFPIQATRTVYVEITAPPAPFKGRRVF